MTTYLSTQLATDVETATGASGVLSLGWLLIALPLLGAAVLLLGGRRTDSAATGSAPRCRRSPSSSALALFIALLGRDAEDRAVTSTLYTWIPVGTFQVDVGLLVDPLSMCFVLLITVRRHADPHLLRRLHGARPRPAAVLRLPQPVRRRDAAARPGQQLPPAVRRLGGRRPRVVPADRLLELQAGLRRRRQEGLRRQPGRRLRPVDRDHDDVRAVRQRHLRRGVRRRPTARARRRSPRSA